jgi:hypothetical protein
MPESRDDEFYVGYLDRAPTGIATRTRFAVILILLVVSVVALLLVRGQKHFDPSRFEFGIVREFRGVVLERPFPVLLVPRPGETEGNAPFSQLPLTGATKFGADAAVAGFDGEAVSLEGSLTYRDGQTQIKLASGTVRRLEPDEVVSFGEERPRRVDLGEQTLAGEIVDSMCWMGLMKPGASKPHRACAARCISGGAPPVLLVRAAVGAPAYYLLVSRDGEALSKELLDVIAEPVEITGRIVRDGDLLFLYADRADIRRL